ncbi:transposase IS4 family protein [Caballeronia choica]|jgi:transposase|uniref:Transposase IS4 family protein n=1 Tax=Caballeronia choica TaxID=326476 RepID=A0A158L5A6_9BURK|nr:IS1182 family transposase [Caballeronia choica]SAL88538.1 transposase IS4 family protein [Caballeronia choica]
MTTSYLPYDPQQQFLLPHALQDWLPEGHLAYFISDTVDSLDLSAFHARYAGGGARNQPFHPAMMVKVLVYGYATGVFSSRKLARKLHEDVAFRVLAAGNYPAHRTLCDFRAFHLKELSDLFVQVVKLAKECGLVKLGTVAVDGTKIKANASRHKAMSYERMKKVELELKEQIDALLAKAKAADAAEKNEPELDIPAEITRREDRLAVIRAARARLEERQRQTDIARGRSDDDAPPHADGEPKKKSRFKYKFGEPKPDAQENFTDPESRIMKHAGGGFDYSYNAQAAVDEAGHIIVAAELGNSAADSGQLPTVLAAVLRDAGADPKQVLADAGYRSEATFEQLREHPAELIVALGREGKKDVKIDASKRPLCAAMAEKFTSAETQAAYRKRKWLSEPPNAWVKSVLGFRQFSMRGLAKAQAEWKLVCTALNLRRMAKMMYA